MEMAAFALVAVPTNTLPQSPQILCISPHKYFALIPTNIFLLVPTNTLHWQQSPQILCISPHKYFALVAGPTNTFHQSPQILCIGPYKYFALVLTNTLHQQQSPQILCISSLAVPTNTQCHQDVQGRLGCTRMFSVQEMWLLRYYGG